MDKMGMNINMDRDKDMNVNMGGNNNRFPGCHKDMGLVAGTEEVTYFHLLFLHDTVDIQLHR